MASKVMARKLMSLRTFTSKPREQIHTFCNRPRVDSFRLAAADPRNKYKVVANRNSSNLNHRSASRCEDRLLDLLLVALMGLGIDWVADIIRWGYEEQDHLDMKIERERTQKVTEQDYERRDSDDVEFWARVWEEAAETEQGKEGKE